MEETSIYYHFAEEFALNTDCSFFLTGKAGTGKTTFLHDLHNRLHKQHAIVAPTGVAAINAGGVTMHSFFQLPLTPFVPTEEGKRNLISKLKIRSDKRRIFKELEVLIIDEISMVRADILDAVDTILRHFRYCPNRPFGGVQVIYIGDMYQLSPVITDEEMPLMQAYYQGPYFFQSRVVQQQPPIYIELDKIFRQSNADFIELLNGVRNNALSDESYELLQSRYLPDFEPAKNEHYIKLTTHNHKADAINEEKLAEIKEPEYSFAATISGDFPQKSYPCPEVMVLKKNARVMFISNDHEQPRRFYNGKIGVITDIGENKICVTCDGEDEEIKVPSETWENISYKVNRDTKQIEEEVLGTYTQYPLRLAWAITIHKSQGLTFDKAIIDIEDAFAAGQVYVALSRCRTLDGMVLSSTVRSGSMIVDPTIVRYSQQQMAEEELVSRLTKAKLQYRNNLLLNLFDFSAIVEQQYDLCSIVRDASDDTFNAETKPFVDSVLEKLKALQDTSGRFQKQLRSIIMVETPDEVFLQERLKAAATYYANCINDIVEMLKNSPVVCESKESARAFDEGMEIIFSSLIRTKRIIEYTQNEFTVENYFAAKNSFLPPRFTVKSYAGTANTTAKDSKHPELFNQLRNIRNDICADLELPIYFVATTKTLVEMSNLLPTDMKALQKISGFGEKKAEKYGHPFITAIKKYCKLHHLNPSVFDVAENSEKTPTPKEPIQPKYPDLFEFLKTICREIAESEGLKSLQIDEQMLVEMTNLLPSMPEQLSQISGFDKKENMQYADLFLENINAYCFEHDILRPIFTAPKKKKKAAKAEKKESRANTVMVTFELYKSGKTIEQIAETRGMTEGTIYNHLGRCAADGLMPLTDIVPEENINAIKKVSTKLQRVAEIYDLLEGKVSYDEIRIVQLWRNANEED